MASIEFEALLEFLDKQYAIQKEEVMGFIENIELKKSILDYRKSEHFFEEASRKRDY